MFPWWSIQKVWKISKNSKEVAVKSFGWVNFKRNRFPIYEKCCKTNRLASVGILGKEREPEVGSLGWQENFDTGFESYFVQNPVCRFFKVS